MLFSIEFLFFDSLTFLCVFVHFLMHAHGSISAPPWTDSSPYISSKEFKVFTLDVAD